MYQNGFKTYEFHLLFLSISTTIISSSEESLSKSFLSISLNDSSDETSESDDDVGNSVTSLVESNGFFWIYN